MKGLVTRSTGLWYDVKSEAGEIISCRLKGKFRQEINQVTNPIATGDRVEFILEENKKNGIITSIEPRTNYIIRKSSRKEHFDHIIASNLDQALLIATFKMPRTSLGFIDRFLVVATSFEIPVIIVFNKSDLLKERDLNKFNDIAAYYSKIGYPCHLISALNNDLEAIKQLLNQKTTLLFGHSGTGKSTLLNTLFGEEIQHTKGLTSQKKGSHTTTFAQMFEWSENSYLVDIPGIKEFGITHIEPAEIGLYFPDFKPFIGQCKFYNCSHKHEPNCAIQAAIKEGKISDWRYKSYLSMINE